MTQAQNVSVIIPAFQAAETIGRALDSVARQTAPPGEVIVVDDGSNDATADAARKAAQALPAATKFILVEQANAGPGAARNRALRESSGDWTAFLDADDLWLPEKLERTMAALVSGGFDLIAHNGMTVAGGVKTLNDCAARFRASADPFTGLYRKGYLDTCTVIMRRADIFAAGGFDESLPNAQDFDLWLRVLRGPGKTFTVLDDVLSEAFETPGGVMSFVERRLACCRIVARRYARDLRGRPGGGARGFIYRIAAVHGEAVQAHLRRGRPLRALWAAARAPWALMIDGISVFVRSPARPSHL
ncbi:MAG: glycosyltransferase family 2 protein [Rhodospirillales bacterium]